MVHYFKSAIRGPIFDYKYGGHTYSHTYIYRILVVFLLLLPSSSKHRKLVKLVASLKRKDGFSRHPGTFRYLTNRFQKIKAARTMTRCWNRNGGKKYKMKKIRTFCIRVASLHNKAVGAIALQTMNAWCISPFIFVCTPCGVSEAILQGHQGRLLNLAQTRSPSKYFTVA